MKNFMLFAGDEYYPLGGMCDFAGHFDTLEAASEFLNGKGIGCANSYDWAHTYNIQDESMLWLRKNSEGVWHV